MSIIKAASVQFQHAQGDKTYNISRIEDFTSQAARASVDLICFPEMCVTGYWHVRNLSKEAIITLAEAVPGGPTSEILFELSRTHKITIGAGLIELDGENLYNTYLVAMPDGSFARHRKIHCFISEHMSSGREITVFDTPLGIRIGVLICYDNNINENVRMTALDGADVLLAPHQTGGCTTPSPMCMGRIDPVLWDDREINPDAIEREFRGPKGREWLMRWLPARAHDNGMFLLFANGVGRDDDEVRTGNAMILDPYGGILAETWRAADSMVIADLDMNLRRNCTGVRWMASRRPELYGPIARATGREEEIRKVRFHFGQ